MADLCPPISNIGGRLVASTGDIRQLVWFMQRLSLAVQKMNRIEPSLIYVEKLWTQTRNQTQVLWQTHTSALPPELHLGDPLVEQRNSSTNISATLFPPLLPGHSLPTIGASRACSRGSSPCGGTHPCPELWYGLRGTSTATEKRVLRH